MPPRFAYWTIIFGGQPTAFRSATRDELLPTFKQIQSKHPDAQLRYFARGTLWYSDEEARAALIRERFERRERPRPTGPKPTPGPWKPHDENRPPRRKDWKPHGDSRPTKPGGWKPRADVRKPETERWKPSAESRKPRPSGEHRGREWRPGGAHEDPRARFKVPRDVKRQGMARKFGWKKKKDDE